MNSGGGGGCDYEPESIVKYAPYVEEKHKSFLNTAYLHRSRLIDDSPYNELTKVEIESAFFSVGYVLSDFPALYEMFGKNMAGLNIEELWDDSLEDTLLSDIITALSNAEAEILDDDIETKILPELSLAMWNANAVTTSTFVIAKANVEKARTLTMGNFNNNLRYTLLPDVQNLWNQKLNWKRSLIEQYARIMKLYYLNKLNVNKFNYGMSIENKLWPFIVLDWERSALGALQGARSSTSGFKKDGASDLESALGGALGGAGVGAQVGMAVGGPVGAAWGAGIGAIFGIAASFF